VSAGDDESLGLPPAVKLSISRDALLAISERRNVGTAIRAGVSDSPTILGQRQPKW